MQICPDNVEDFLNCSCPDWKDPTQTVIGHCHATANMYMHTLHMLSRRVTTKTAGQSAIVKALLKLAADQDSSQPARSNSRCFVGVSSTLGYVPYTYVIYIC